MSFESLGLTPALCNALAACGYVEPTPIQRASIPLVLDGGDLLASAQTGTGKTAAFALPLLQKLFVDGRRASPLAPRAVRVLVLTPTRELAAQIHQSFVDYAGTLPLKSAVVFGGVGMPAQVKALAGGLDVLIATPGRLLDHAQQRTVDLSAVATVVLDEADRMLDMGFLPAIKRVLALLPKRRQTLLYSATFSAPIKALAAQFLHQPREVAATVRNAAATTVSHLVHPVAPGHKRELLLHLLARDSRQQTLVFTRTKHGANRMAEFLADAGLAAAAIHGNKSQGARTRALADFKANKITVLVATDIAARGLDIEQLPLVVNVDLPHVAEDYVHRIGRTGRAGAEGQAISLVSPDERGLLREIEKLIGRAIPVEAVTDFVPSARASAVETPRPPRPPQAPRRSAAPAAARSGPRSDNGPRKAQPQAPAPRPGANPARTRSFGGRARGGR